MSHLSSTRESNSIPQQHRNPSIAVVIPCFRVRRKISQVLSEIEPYVANIYVVDDCCPENSGEYVANNIQDPRITVIYHTSNLGVGAAFITGMQRALMHDAEIIVKIDGDGQMDPSLIPAFVQPILSDVADFTKGNRFYYFDFVKSMPFVRKVGNLALSFLTKMSSGNWHIFDPTNGFFAIHRSAAQLVSQTSIDSRYFFESDLQYKLNMIDAVICDIPMVAKYSDETSSLQVYKVLPEFLWKNIRNFIQRLTYTYFIRDVNIATFQLLFSSLFLGFSLCFGSSKWWQSHTSNIPAPAGTVMLASLTFLVGFMLLISFVNYDINKRQTIPLKLRSVDRIKNTHWNEQYDKSKCA